MSMSAERKASDHARARFRHGTGYDGIRGQDCSRCRAAPGSPCVNGAGGETAEHAPQVTNQRRPARPATTAPSNTPDHGSSRDVATWADQRCELTLSTCSQAAFPALLVLHSADYGAGHVSLPFQPEMCIDIILLTGRGT